MGLQHGAFGVGEHGGNCRENHVSAVTTLDFRPEEGIAFSLMDESPILKEGQRLVLLRKGADMEDAASNRLLGVGSFRRLSRTMNDEHNSLLPRRSVPWSCPRR